MRRKDRELTAQNDLEAIMQSADVCRIALNTGAAPYIVPLNYGFTWDVTLKLYFHCAVAGRKLDLIGKDCRAGFEIDVDHRLVTGPQACDWGMKYASVVGYGHIVEVSDRKEKIHGLNLLMKQYGYPGTPVYPEAMLDAVRILCLYVEEISGKARR